MLFFLLGGVNTSAAQGIIEEKLYLDFEEEVSSLDKIDIEDDFQLSSYWYEYYEHFFFPKEPGDLHISLARGFSQLREIDSTATLNVTVKGKNQRRDTTLSVQPILGEPLTGARIQFDSSTMVFLWGRSVCIFQFGCK